MKNEILVFVFRKKVSNLLLMVFYMTQASIFYLISQVIKYSSNLKFRNRSKRPKRQFQYLVTPSLSYSYEMQLFWDKAENSAC